MIETCRDLKDEIKMITHFKVRENEKVYQEVTFN